ncbi:MAG: hypothetical protein D3916_14535, partial [Candidatus Electrothrix sp. MAN1_4]|nr:hypothetical protein [Candidatus Electrothrix sp. MAN1_4]
NRQLANGFLLHHGINQRTVQIRNLAGGCEKVLKKFQTDYLDGMKKYPCRTMLFLIDFDRKKERLKYIRSKIPQELTDRVFVLGVWSEPEKLKAKTGMTSFEQIGTSLTEGCPKSKNALWDDDLLRHNQAELERIIASTVSFLFS